MSPRAKIVFKSRKDNRIKRNEKTFYPPPPTLPLSSAGDTFRWTSGGPLKPKLIACQQLPLFTTMKRGSWTFLCSISEQGQRRTLAGSWRALVTVLKSWYTYKHDILSTGCVEHEVKEVILTFWADPTAWFGSCVSFYFILFWCFLKNNSTCSRFYLKLSPFSVVSHK